ncbi:transcriptional regulator [Alphaproteobacteria bacterium]|nr:transcriptional regulator [Alphaproteobacteria bacterium]
MMALKTKKFDVADWIQTDEEISAFLSMVLADGDAKEISRALGYVARARGMAQVARKAKLSRESLYRALSPNNSGNMRASTMLKLMGAMGISLTASAAAPAA